MKTISFFRHPWFFTACFSLLNLSALPAFTQISGIVSDAENRQALYAATVIIKHTAIGTCTNAKGYYQLPAHPGDTLVVSFIGYHSTELIASPWTDTVALQPDHAILEECDVTGYASGRTLRNACAIVSGSDTEEYAHFKANTFQSVLRHPLSTFSIDVDAASYANLRRFVHSGQLPPADAIRTEELINYFSYDYPLPGNSHPVGITAEIAACPWNEQHRLLHIGLRAQDINPRQLPASNLVFLIDVSGSMAATNKLPLLKSALQLLVAQLRETDRIAIVTYAGETQLALPSTSGKEKTKILERIGQLQAAGFTAGGAGIRKAYQTARQHFIPQGNNRIILATDGDFNLGPSSDEELTALIEKERKSGIYLTVLGFGMGNYKDRKLQLLAQKGNGNHAYIDNLDEARRVLVEGFAGSLYTLAKEVKLQLEFNPAKIQAYRLIGYESRLLEDEDFNNDRKDAGEIGIGHTVTALYELIPVGTKSYTDPLKYQSNKTPSHPESNETLTIKLRYQLPQASESRKIEMAVTDQQRSLSQTSDDFRFSAAVAAVGMLLTHSAYANGYTYQQISNLARQALGSDPGGYRREFIRLVENIRLLESQQ